MTHENGRQATLKALEVAGFKVKTIETTGAGDCFMGVSLGYILDHDLANFIKT